MNPPDIALGMIWYVVFLFSTTCHEASHALAAKLGGDLTAFEGGQVTLNPFPHIRRSPFGMVVVPILSFALGGWMIGWASAPFDRAWQERHPHRSAIMALAGPAANFALMLLAGVGIRLGMAAGAFGAAGTGSPDLVRTALGIAFLLNLLLGTFNLLPVPPLDGYAAIMLLMPVDTARRYLHWVSQSGFAFLGLFLAWTLFGRVFDTVYDLALRLLYLGR